MKKVLFAFVAIFVFGFLSSCLDCKECCMVTRIDGEITEETDCANFCDEELSEKESEEPVVVGNQSIGWECGY